MGGGFEGGEEDLAKGEGDYRVAEEILEKIEGLLRKGEEET